MADEKKAWEKGGPSPNPTGRPKNYLDAINKIDEILYQVDPEDPQGRTHFQLAAMAFVRSLKTGGVRVWSEYLDRKMGKPIQMTLEGNLSLSREERVAKLEQLLAVLPNVSDSPKPN